MGGALLPFGGAKGSALALLVEMLAGVLSGAAIGPAVGNPNDPSSAPADVGHAFIVLDPEAFLPRAAFEARTAQLGDLVRGSRKASGADAVRMPGTGASTRREDTNRQGIALSTETVELLEKELRPLGLHLPAPAGSAII
jgi:LDH2 family malate/lactate/ureidoglycolate dehydrogenase